jgi:hypothetical protein
MISKTDCHLVGVINPPLTLEEKRKIKNNKLITNKVHALLKDKSIPKGANGMILNISNCSNIL